ncbi:MAG: ATP-binding cassette domain-containing protein [Geminicoccaceae bacterium]|nr:ATP-binding cassette domain-containing protein [Geminicoccaceae bacterium]MCS7269109.1 ATP-binding cassette domain-containing protein [Geminicoccaceae bacterium]MDW8125788.1 ATP-binding cassette domain-containing protein [Geminicoccaceae bacterium]MDW8340540.1 ATP-binding cassette domain-containing protein [Geminicoccaceae bacterium]
MPRAELLRPGGGTPAPGIRLEVERLLFDGAELFRDLVLEIPGGRWTCLLGPSGVGKSTLLRLLAGLLPGAARVASDGLPLSGRIAWMAQSDLLFPWLSVLDNLVVGYRLRGAPRALLAEKRAQARSLLEKIGLGGYAEALPAALSGGMRQRAALARTLLEDRPVVLMDEPFSALDAITRHRLQDLAAELLAGRTVVLVTHSPLEALRLGHEVRILEGRPVRLDPPLQIGGRPPREAADPALLALEARLLARLAGGDALAEAA